jgi:hypothetical protein
VNPVTHLLQAGTGRTGTLGLTPGQAVALIALVLVVGTRRGLAR